MLNFKDPYLWIKQQYSVIFKRRRSGKSRSAPVSQLSLWPGLVVATISVGLSAVGAWGLLEQQSYDNLHQAKRKFTGEPMWDSRVVIIAIDEASVVRLGRFPWSRSRYADLLNQLQSAQPAAITFDILFPEPTDQDLAFGQAIADSGNVVLAVGTDQPGNYLNVSPSIAEQADGFFLRGDIGSRGDNDGVSRRLPLASSREGVPALSLATLQVYADTLANTFQSEVQSGAVGSAEIFPAALIPPNETVWINWPGEATAAYQSSHINDLKTYSYADVVDGLVDTQVFQNKIVLVGATIGGIDPLRTPFHKDVPVSGVYLYAAALNNLLNQSFLRRPSIWHNTLVLVGLSFLGS